MLLSRKIRDHILGGANPLQKPPVFIECGSANSFELSPRFANLAIRGSRVGSRGKRNNSMMCSHEFLNFNHFLPSFAIPAVEIFTSTLDVE